MSIEYPTTNVNWLDAMMKGNKKSEPKSKAKMSNDEIVSFTVQEIKKAVPDIEKRLMEREALVAESRFESPRAADIVTRKNSD